MMPQGNPLGSLYPGMFPPQNGTGLLLPPSSPYVMPSREDIVEMVGEHERDVKPLRLRMEADYDRYRLIPHVNVDRGTGQVLEHLAVYTSNAPRVFADKIISWLTLAELLVRVPHVEVGGHEPEVDNRKERFAIGNLRAADERLKRLLQPSLRGQMAFYTTVRGGYLGGRALLVKRPDGTTYADITAWDPMHMHWELSDRGLEWVCYKIKKTRAQIYREYGVDIGGGVGVFGRFFHRGSSDAEKEGTEVYDFYDGVMNTIVTDKDTLKPPTPHGSPRVPAYLTLVGPMPLLQSDTATNLVADVGESVYAGARDIWDKKNDLMSIFQEIVERARDQTVITESADGKKTLPQNPFKKGTEIGLRTGEKVYTLELQKMAQDTMNYITVILGEEQRATLPHSSYGETPFQLSGFAITQLRQATETVLSSRVEALESAYSQITGLLYDQFMTGAFDGMQLSGVDSKRSYFNQTITPKQLANSCDYEVKLVSQLPQDDASKWATAQIAKTLGLMGDVDILDKVIGVQDAQQTIDKVRLQKAEEGLPEAQLYTMMMAAAQRSSSPDDESAQIAKMYLMELQRLMMVKLGVMPDMAPKDGSGGGGQGTPAKAPGPRPEVLPNAMTGAPPEPETSNQGPSRVAPNTPRPGAQGQPG